MSRQSSIFIMTMKQHSVRMSNGKQQFHIYQVNISRHFSNDASGIKHGDIRIPKMSDKLIFPEISLIGKVQLTDQVQLTVFKQFVGGLVGPTIGPIFG